MGLGQSGKVEEAASILMDVVDLKLDERAGVREFHQYCVKLSELVRDREGFRAEITRAITEHRSALKLPHVADPLS